MQRKARRRESSLLRVIIFCNARDLCHKVMHNEFKLNIVRAIGADRGYSVIILACLAFGCVRPAFPAELKLAPIATRTVGSVSYDIEQRSIDGGSPSLRQRAVLNVRNKAITYISQPWLAQVKSDVSIAFSKNKINTQSSSSQRLSGNIGLDLVPYSQYPFSAALSRSQNYQGHGFGSLTSQTTRLDLTQRLVPRRTPESYQLGYNLLQSESFNPPEIYTSSVIDFSMLSSRFKDGTLKLNAVRRRDKQRYSAASHLANQANVEYRYLPSSEFSWENNAYLKTSIVSTERQYDKDRSREANSTMRYRPRNKAYSGIATARVHALNYDSLYGSAHTRIGNANVSGVYRISQHYNFSASGNISIQESESQRSTNLSATQALSANFSLASFDVDGYHYSSRLSGSISNSSSSNSTRNSLSSPGYNTTVRSGSQQNASLSPSHSLSRTTLLNGGSLRIRFDQSLSLSEGTSSQARARLTHGATANWKRKIVSISLTGRDSRSLNSNQESFQFFNFNLNASNELTRYSTISASISIQATRQINTGLTSSRSDSNSAAIAHYGNTRTFSIPRMSFNSDLRAYSRSAIPVLASSPSEQGPITWENILSYTVGKLVTDFKVALSKESDGSSQSVIWLSLKRYF